MIAVVYAHPYPDRSRANRLLLDAVGQETPSLLSTRYFSETPYRMGEGHAAKLSAKPCADVGATSLATLVQMVAGGLGVTLLPRLAADGGAAAGAAVAIRPFAEPVIGRSIGVAWRAGSAREEEARLLAALLREAVFAPKANLSA